MTLSEIKEVAKLLRVDPINLVLFICCASPLYLVSRGEYQACITILTLVMLLRMPLPLEVKKEE